MKTFKTFVEDTAPTPPVQEPKSDPMSLLDALGDEIEQGVDYRDVYTKETIITVDQLSQIPEKSILWYPVHDVDHAGFMPPIALLYYIKDGKKSDPRDITPYDTPMMSKRTKRAMYKVIKELDGPGYALTDNSEFELPLIDVTSEEMDPESNAPNPELNAFCKFAKSKGYSFYKVPYGDGHDPNNIRHYWSID